VPKLRGGKAPAAGADELDGSRLMGTAEAGRRFRKAERLNGVLACNTGVYSLISSNTQSSAVHEPSIPTHLLQPKMDPPVNPPPHTESSNCRPNSLHSKQSSPRALQTARKRAMALTFSLTSSTSGDVWRSWANRNATPRRTAHHQTSLPNLQTRWTREQQLRLKQVAPTSRRQRWATWSRWTVGSVNLKSL
jgi:hypothetical protein